MIKKIFFLNTLLLFISGIVHIGCDTNNLNITVYLSMNEIYFFETTNFPELLADDEFALCNLTFILDDKDPSTEFLLYLKQTIITIEDFPELFYRTIFTKIINQTFYSFEPSKLYHSIARQGYILFEELKDSKCPMEIICNPFIFSDESENLCIESADKGFLDRKNSCNWKFLAPHGFGFKVLIDTFDISSSINLVIENSTDIIINNRNVRTNYPYYNSDNFIQISVSKLHEAIFNQDPEFRAYVSIIKKNVAKSDGNCSVTESDDAILWSNQDNNNNKGYGNNIFCKFEINISSKFTYLVHSFYLFEPFVDYISYYYSNNQDHVQKLFMTAYTESEAGFFLESFEKERKVLFEFVSDGNGQAIGFNMTFTKYVCECQNSSIPCNSEAFTILKDTKYVCGTLKCNFTIEPCSTKLGVAFISYTDPGNIKNSFDVFKIYSNEYTVFELDSNNNVATSNSYVYLKSANKNIFEVQIFSSPAVKYLTFSFKNFTAPSRPDLSVQLSNELQIYVFDTAIFTLAVFSTVNSFNGHTFEIVTTGFTNIYENKSLTILLNNRNCLTIDLTCKLNINEFAIFTENKLSAYYPIVAVRTTENVKGCVFGKNNIYHINDNSSIGALSTQNESCTIYILTGTFLYLTNLWTTSNFKNVKIFIGTNKDFLLHAFNSKTATKITNIGLFSTSYIVEIPPNSAVFMTFVKSSPFPSHRSLTIDQFPFNSLIVTPDFGISKMNFLSRGAFIVYEIGNFSVKFTPIYFNINSGDEVYFKIDDSKLPITKIGQIFTFKNQNVSLFYGIKNYHKNILAGAWFYIESIES